MSDNPITLPDEMNTVISIDKLEKDIEKMKENNTGEEEYSMISARAVLPYFKDKLNKMDIVSIDKTIKDFEDFGINSPENKKYVVDYIKILNDRKTELLNAQKGGKKATVLRKSAKGSRRNSSRRSTKCARKSRKSARRIAKSSRKSRKSARRSRK